MCQIEPNTGVFRHGSAGRRRVPQTPPAGAQEENYRDIILIPCHVMLTNTDNCTTSSRQGPASSIGGRREQEGGRPTRWLIRIGRPMSRRANTFEWGRPESPIPGRP
ncbi:MAG: hypothetical protein ACE5LU_20305 [Anaerolineae bacterium]